MSYKKFISLVLAVMLAVGANIFAPTAVFADFPMEIDYTQPNKISDIFPDPGLAQAVADWFNEVDGFDLTIDSVVSTESIEQRILSSDNRGFNAWNRNIHDLTGLRIFAYTKDNNPYAYLMGINFSNNQIEDVSEFSYFHDYAGLRNVSFYNNQVTDIETLQYLPIETLNLSGNPLQNTGSGGEMSYLKDLNLASCNLGDLSPVFLRQFPNLEELDLSNNKLADINTAFSNAREASKEKLRQLNASNNRLTDITAIREFSQFGNVNIRGNFINIFDGENQETIESLPHGVKILTPQLKLLAEDNIRVSKGATYSPEYRIRGTNDGNSFTISASTGVNPSQFEVDTDEMTYTIEDETIAAGNPDGSISGNNIGSTTIKAHLFGVDSDYTTHTFNIEVVEGGIVTIKHIDVDTGEILLTETDALEFDVPKTYLCNWFDGYVYAGATDNITITLTEAEPEKTITFEYRKLTEGRLNAGVYTTAWEGIGEAEVIVLEQTSGEQVGYGITDEWGWVELGKFPLGTYDVVAIKDGYGNEYQEYVIKDEYNYVEFLLHAGEKAGISGSIIVEHRDVSDDSILDIETFSELPLGEHIISSKLFPDYMLAAGEEPTKTVYLTYSEKDKTVVFYYEKGPAPPPARGGNDNKKDSDNEKEENIIVEVPEIDFGDIVGNVYLLNGDKKVNQTEVEVFLFDVRDNLISQAISTEEGFVFEDLPIGEYKVKAELNDSLIQLAAYFVSNNVQEAFLSENAKTGYTEFVLKVPEIGTRLPETGDNGLLQDLIILIGLMIALKYFFFRKKR
jgi:hypothetical protein